MKRILIAAAAFASLATASYAADLPARMPLKAAAPLPAMTWTGCYVGAGGGYGMWNQDHTTLVSGVPVTPEATAGGRGWFGTVQLGCDYQFNTNWLIGAFGDADWGNIRGDLNDVTTGVTLYGREKQKWSWAAGGRVGYLVYPQLLTYVSGGYTAARFDQVNLATFAGVASGFYPEHTYNGWFIGTGYEYQLSFLPGLAWKTEYRFSDYGTDNLLRYTPAGVLTTASMDSHKYEQVIRSELVWRFNFWR
jgi:outer membrane immunogenic protein